MQVVAWKYFSVVMAVLLVLGLGASVLTSGPVEAEAPPPQQWVQRYGVVDGDSQAAAIAVDGSGNAYVTGYSANGTDLDCVTIKYSPSGAQLWVARYGGGFGHDCASAIAVDSSGNAYITGYSNNGTDEDYLTIKYRSSDGHQEWAMLYDGGFGDDEAYAIAVDVSGNAYITGYNSTAGDDSYVTIKYNTTGVQQWVMPYAGGSGNHAAAIALDSGGNAYVTGYSYNIFHNRDYATIKYRSSDGHEEWAARYVDSTSKAGATAIAVDGSGNAYVTGYRRGAASNMNYATVKYRSSDGNQEWASVYDGGVGNDEANAIAVDGSGNAYVTGKSRGAGGDDYATVKYSTGGVQQWVSRYDGGFGNDEARAIAVDGSGNAYVTGYVWGGVNYDCATIKYSTGGVEQWVMLYNGPDNDNDGATAIALGSI